MTDASYKEKPRLFKPTPQRRKELRIRRIWGEDYAFNVELYDRLQAEARQSKRAEKREAAGEKAATKETAEAQRAKAKAQAEIFAKRLYRWKIAWLQPRAAGSRNAAI